MIANLASSLLSRVQVVAALLRCSSPALAQAPAPQNPPHTDQAPRLFLGLQGRSCRMTVLSHILQVTTTSLFLK